MAHLIDADKLKAEIERLKSLAEQMDYQKKVGFNWALDDLLSFLSTLEKECGDFPTTDEEMTKFLTTHPKVDVPDRYKTPDWMFEKSEKPIIPDGLDEEVHRFFEECIEVHEVPLYGKVKEGVITVDCYEITARHFAQWSAEHLKK